MLARKPSVNDRPFAVACLSTVKHCTVLYIQFFQCYTYSRELNYFRSESAPITVF